MIHRFLNQSFRDKAGQGLPTGHSPTGITGVDRGRGTVDAKGVNDPPGRQTEVGAGEPVRSAYGVSVGGRKLVVAVSQSHEHTGQRARHRLRGQKSMLASPTQLVSLKARW